MKTELAFLFVFNMFLLIPDRVRERDWETEKQ